MKKIYVFPLIGAIVTLFGLCFPVVSVYDGVIIWLWGFYTVEHKNRAYFRITYEKEFEMLNNNGKEISKKIIKKYKKYYNAGYNEYLTKFRISN